MSITFREITDSEVGNVCELIKDNFNEFVAPGYEKLGVNEFLKYITPEATLNRLSKNHFILVALDGNLVIGVIEVRNLNHISLFFVRKGYQNRGVGRRLNELAIGKCRELKQDSIFIDVHSSPYAVPIYQKFGFVKQSEEQVVNGIRYIPMVIKIR